MVFFPDHGGKTQCTHIQFRIMEHNSSLKAFPVSNVSPWPLSSADLIITSDRRLRISIRDAMTLSAFNSRNRFLMVFQPGVFISASRSDAPAMYPPLRRQSVPAVRNAPEDVPRCLPALSVSQHWHLWPSVPPSQHHLRDRSSICLRLPVRYRWPDATFQQGDADLHSGSLYPIASP